MSKTVHLEKQTEHEQPGVRCWIVTVSDTRDPQRDTTGQYLKTALSAAGHRVERYVIVHDDEGEIGQQLQAAKADPAVQAIILHGGTGISTRDVTVKTVQAFLDETIDGFGELFRSLSYEDIGSSAMLSRAVAGVVGTTIVFALPGSTAACELALDRLIVPELGHIAKLLGHQR